MGQAEVVAAMQDGRPKSNPGCPYEGSCLQTVMRTSVVGHDPTKQGWSKSAFRRIHCGTSKRMRAGQVCFSQKGTELFPVLGSLTAALNNQAVSDWRDGHESGKTRQLRDVAVTCTKANDLLLLYPLVIVHLTTSLEGIGRLRHHSA